MSLPTVTVSTGHVEFGGTRIPGGQASSTLWSDGVVISHAWTLDPESPVHDTMFTFRGTVVKTGRTGRDAWALRREGDGGLMDTYRTRREAVYAARDLNVRDAFRALAAIEALAERAKPVDAKAIMVAVLREARTPADQADAILAALDRAGCAVLNPQDIDWGTCPETGEPHHVSLDMCSGCLQYDPD